MGRCWVGLLLLSSVVTASGLTINASTAEQAKQAHVAVGSTQLPAKVYPIKWTKAIKLTSVGDISGLLHGSPPEPSGQSGVLLVKGKHQQKVTTCNGYLAMTGMGYTPANNAEMAAASFYIDYCLPLYQLEQTQPAKVSYIRNFSLASSYNELPAIALMPNLGGPGPRGLFGAVYPHAKMRITGIQYIRLKHQDEIAHVKVLAWGDRDHDGVDDMLLGVSHYVTDGSYRAYDLVWVTRKKAGGPITVMPPIIQSME